MAAWQIFKVSRKTFFDPGSWLDVDAIKRSNIIIWNSVRDLFVTATPDRKESFDGAIKRLGVSEHDVQEAEKNYFAFKWLFILLGGITAVFGFYLLFYHRTFSGWILALAAAALFFGQAFRYSFWHFQIKNRKLGCTLKEWRSGKISDKEPNKP